MRRDHIRVWMYSMLKVRPWTRHSLILAIIGLGHVVIGASYLYLVEGGPRYKMLVVALNLLPIGFWAHLWMAVGASIILSAVWPANYDRWGYATAVGMASAWSTIYISGAFYQEGQDYGANVLMGALFALVAFLSWGISGLVNPDDIAIVVVDDEPH